MSADPIAVPLPSAARIASYWQSTKTATKTVVMILAVIGAAHVTEPLRADASSAVAPTPSSTGSKLGGVVPGK